MATLNLTKEISCWDRRIICIHTYSYCLLVLNDQLAKDVLYNTYHTEMKKLETDLAFLESASEAVKVKMRVFLYIAEDKSIPDDVEIKYICKKIERMDASALISLLYALPDRVNTKDEVGEIRKSLDKNKMSTSWKKKLEIVKASSKLENSYFN